jgi:hypothetical protein
VRTTLVVPWLSDDLVFQRGCRGKPLFVLLFVRMMLVKWKGNVLKSGGYCKVGLILKRLSVMVRVVVGEMSVGTQSHISLYRGCNIPYCSTSLAVTVRPLLHLVCFMIWRQAVR